MTRRNKYNVATRERRVFNGELYDSLKEKNYAIQLECMKTAIKLNERVEKVERQIPYTIMVNETLICKYVLDFKVTYNDGRVEYVDVKGMKTPVYNLKKKLMKVINGIEIKEV